MDVKRMLCGKVEDVELLYEDWDFDQGKWGFTHPKISCKIHAMLCASPTDSFPSWVVLCRIPLKHPRKTRQPVDSQL